jgi:hypothetical protein
MSTPVQEPKMDTEHKVKRQTMEQSVENKHLRIYLLSNIKIQGIICLLLVYQITSPSGSVILTVNFPRNQLRYNMNNTIKMAIPGPEEGLDLAIQSLTQVKWLVFRPLHGYMK